MNEARKQRVYISVHTMLWTGHSGLGGLAIRLKT